ncbi:MAG: hypothetical protein BZ135_01550 [Methanosphaera sp. rholeuAM6]|nr:MAG: hypothetical protein BZ135_01550 [Methanosphaera sp. rholeuAM6]
MLIINLDTIDKQLIDSYKLIKNTSKIINKKGETKEYISYNCSFPYSFVEMYDNPNSIYFYKCNNKSFITNYRPSNQFKSQKVKLQDRKSSNHNSDSNNNRTWAKLMTVPKRIMGNVGNYKELTYVLHINQKDYVSGKDALLEVYLT